MSKYRVVVARSGCAKVTADGHAVANCSISLVLGNKTILFDPGSPWDGSLIGSILLQNDLTADKISHVICSHGHVDHVGNLNQFPNATIIVGRDIMKENVHLAQTFDLDNSYKIDEQVELIYTPGHTYDDVSLVVRDTNEFGTVVIAGDLFESKHDIEDASIWQANSMDHDLQKRSRTRVLEFADYIVPGHGPPFKLSRSS